MGFNQVTNDHILIQMLMNADLHTASYSFFMPHTSNIENRVNKEMWKTDVQ